MRDQNKTFSKMAEAVDRELQHVRDWESQVKTDTEDLNRSKAELANAQIRLAAVRDEMFEAHPELMPSGPAVAAGAEDWSPPGPGMFEPIEVDDPEDLPEFKESP